MDKGHIYIYGQIADFQSEEGGNLGIVSLKNVVESFNAQNADEYDVHIHSVGGDISEGFAIHDFLKNSGKKIITINEGNCYSAATIIYMAGNIRKTTENAGFIFHGTSGMVQGKREEIARYTHLMRDAEEKIVELYKKETSIGKEKLKELMQNETLITAKEAINLGIATELIETLKAVAKFNLNIMNEKKVEVPEKFWVRLNNLLSAKKQIKNIVLKTADDSVEIDFYELKEGETPALDDKARINGNDAEGKYVMANGDIYVFQNGALKEIKQSDNENEELENLKKENEALKEKMKSLTNKFNQHNQAISEIQAIQTQNEEIYNKLKQLVSNVVVDNKELSKPNEVVGNDNSFGTAIMNAKINKNGN